MLLESRYVFNLLHEFLSQKSDCLLEILNLLVSHHSLVISRRPLLKNSKLGAYLNHLVSKCLFKLTLQLLLVLLLCLLKVQNLLSQLIVVFFNIFSIVSVQVVDLAQNAKQTLETVLRG